MISPFNSVLLIVCPRTISLGDLSQEVSTLTLKTLGRYVTTKFVGSSDKPGPSLPPHVEIRGHMIENEPIHNWFCGFRKTKVHFVDESEYWRLFYKAKTKQLEPIKSEACYAVGPIWISAMEKLLEEEE